MRTPAWNKKEFSAEVWMPYWAALPAEIKRSLLSGSVGAPHLLDLAVRAMNLSAGPRDDAIFFASLGREFLLAAWESDPLNGVLAGQLLQLQSAKLPGQDGCWLDSSLTEVLAGVKTFYRDPIEQNYYGNLLKRGNADKILSFLEDRLGDEPVNLYWLAQARSAAITHSATEWFASCLEQAISKIGEGAAIFPVLQYLKACFAYIAGAYEDVGRILESLTTASSSWKAPRQLLGSNMCALGHFSVAGAMWKNVLSARPWHVNLLLTCHDILSTPYHRLASDDLGRIVVLIYSWNKAAYLEKCLKSLSESRADWSYIIVLNNGSTDSSAQVLSAAQAFFGHERLQVITLPVNVGAPAARNWLLHTDAVRNESDFVVFLDDDAEVPADWLRHLRAASVRYPHAFVYGGKVVDALAPGVIQSADLHLLPPREEQQTERGPSFGLSDIHLQDVDLGQFAYMRPCISVTGCCHMFRTKDLLAAGDFSLRFSPSQFDDLEHDLRMAARIFPKRFACYNGFLSVKHHNRTGRSGSRSAEQAGNALGNMHKLYNMYDADDVNNLVSNEAEALELDLSRKVRELLF